MKTKALECFGGPFDGERFFVEPDTEEVEIGRFRYDPDQGDKRPVQVATGIYAVEDGALRWKGEE